MLQEARMNLVRESARTSWRLVRQNLEKVEAQIDSLSDVFYARYGSIRNAAEQIAAQADFGVWKIDNLDELDELLEMLAVKDGTDQTQQEPVISETNAKMMVVKAKINNQESLIESMIVNLQQEISQLSDQEVTVPALSDFTARIADIKQMIRPQLADIYEEFRNTGAIHLHNSRIT